MQCRRSVPVALTIAVLASIALMIGAAQQRAAAPTPTKPAVVIQFTSGPDDVFALTAGLGLAEDAVKDGRRVILFFSKGGARIPMRSLSFDLRIGHDQPVRQRLLALQQHGARLIICGHSAQLLGIYDAEFLDDTFIAETNRALLARMGDNAVVFTY
jgi:predicted peroxiredoxin